MKRIVVALLLVVSVACVRKPSPVASETAPAPPPGERLAIAVEYVAVPTMTVYAHPAADSAVEGSYGLSEAISVLSRNGEWSEIRTFDGSGWVKSADLMSAEKLAELKSNPVPRFYVAPALVDAKGARGEIVFNAKVNTDGDVVNVDTIRNTTGSIKLAEANAESLKAARFYPLVDQGQRKTFTYEHHVYY